jgi:small-conductance mechanosensitive channel
MFDLNAYKAEALDALATVKGWLASPMFYAQVAAIIAGWLLARIVARYVLARVSWLSAEPADGRFLKVRQILFSCRDLLRPILLVLLLAVAVSACDALLQSSWLVRLAQSAAVISLLHEAINRFLKHPLINGAARWLGLPVAALYVFGWMPQVIEFMDGAAFQAGNIRISLLALVKAALFGGLLFWAGKVASTAGQRVIRQQNSIDVQTRELAAKAFDLAVIGVAILLLMNLLGMDMAVLAVFSGAVGVGLGFGLQQIASNFISGIIILLERSLKLGDYIELDDGKTGTLTALNMRSSTLATFDGKQVNVPNEKFITTRFVNWTHSDPRTRYEVPFTVGFDEDLHKVQALVEKALPKVKGVLDEPAKPACELRALGSFGAEFVAKFWVDGLDEGDNAYTSDAALAIWGALKKAGIRLAVSPLPRQRAGRANGGHAAGESGQGSGDGGGQSESENGGGE